MKQKQFKNVTRHANGIVSNLTEKGMNSLKMKRISKLGMVIVLLLGISSTSFAQFNWGVKAGLNASTQSEIGKITDDNGLKAGFNFGVIARYQMNDWMALKSGIDYQGKGLKCDLKDSDSELRDNLQYLILPVKAEFSASEKAGFKNGQRLFFATGPYFGYLLDAEETIQEQTTDLEDLNDFDFGWSFEIGMEFPVLKNKALQVSMNYDMGISEISNDSDIQNKSASLNLGFLF